MADISDKPKKDIHLNMILLDDIDGKPAMLLSEIEGPEQITIVFTPEDMAYIHEWCAKAFEAGRSK